MDANTLQVQFQDFIYTYDFFSGGMYVINTVIGGFLAAGVWSISKKMR